MSVEGLLRLARTPPQPHPDPAYAAMGITIAGHGEPGSSPTSLDVLPTVLDLSGLGLKQLPSEFGCVEGNWSSVTALNLSDNQLQVLELGPAFTGLQALELDSNCLTSLPRLELPELQNLALHDNTLRSIESLDGVPQLTELRIDRNAALTSLPELPQSLQTIHLEGCLGLQSEQLLQQLMRSPLLQDV